MEICMKHAKTPPEPPSLRSGKPVSGTLEALLMRCLAKAPSERPADAAALLRELEECTIAGNWNSAAAALWWAGQEKAVPPARANPEPMGIQQTPSPDSTMAFQDPKQGPA